LGVGEILKGILFQEVDSYAYQVTDIAGKSKNSVFLSETFTERILHVMHGESIVYSM
jgi:hypothetical protein